MTYEEWQNSSKRVADYLAEKIPYHCPRMDNATVRVRLMAAAQQAVYALVHGAQSHEVNLPFIVADYTGPKHLNHTISQKKFLEIIGPSATLPEGSVP